MIQTKLATTIFNLVARNEAASDLVTEVKSLKRGAMVATLLSLTLPFAGVGLWQQFGFKAGWVSFGSAAASLYLAESASKKRKKLTPLQELLADESHLSHQAKKRQLVETYNPEVIKPHIMSGIGGKVQLALKAQGIIASVLKEVDAPAFYRVKLGLVGASIEDVDNKKIKQKITTTLKSDIPIGVIPQGDCDCAIEIAKPDSERRFFKIEQYLIDGFFPVGTPLTWPAGINAENELIKVKVLDPNYIHPLIGGGTGSGKSQALLTWVRWLTQWQPVDVQIVLIDPKQVTFGQLESLGRIGNVAKAMGISEQRAEEMFPDMKSADEFAERMKPWLPFGVVTDPAEAILTYSRMNAEMQRRYKAFRQWGVTNYEEYNALMRRLNAPTMPAYVVITDEYYMQVSDKKFKELTEEQLARLGAMARACGISMVISTQRPSWDILVPKVRDNLMWRCCFRVKGLNPASIILGLQDDDSNQADVTQCLAGKGDAIVEYDGRYERVQSLYWDGSSLPGVPTVFPPADLPEPDEATIAAVGKKQGIARSNAKKVNSTATKAPVADPWDEESTPQPTKTAVKDTDAERKAAYEQALQLYQVYRNAREQGVSVNQFFEQGLNKKSYTAEFKAQFFTAIQPFLDEWIAELHQGDNAGNGLLPEQIVSVVYGTGFPPPAKNREAHAAYLEVVQAVIEQVKQED